MPQLKNDRIFKNLYPETKSVLTEVHEYKPSFSHSHTGKNAFTVDMDIDHY